MALAALSVAIGLGSVATGVARGRGRVDPTMVSAWRTFGLGTAVVAIVAALCVADVRTAPPDRLVSIQFARPGPDQTWALVSGLVREATGYMPSFLVHPMSGAYERLEGLSPLSASTFSADGRVFAAVAGWRRPRANRVMVRGLTADGGISWRAERELRSEQLPRIALSASGRVLAIRTATELSVFDSRTLSPGVRLSQTHQIWRAMGFRDDRVLVTERDVVSSANGRETEIVTVDTETGGVTVVARYRVPRDRRAILDPSARYLLLIDPSRGSQQLRLIDLLSGVESAPLAVEKALILSSSLVLPDGRVVALVRHDAGGIELNAVGAAASLTLPELPASVQWLGGNLVALGFRGQRDVADGDYTLIADVAAGRFTGRETGLLPIAGLHWDSRAGGASTLFVKNRREVVNRPDLAAGRQ